MEEGKKIYSVICNAMSDIGTISKDSKNQKQGYMYRGIDSVYNALQPVLIKHHIFSVPEILEQKREERRTTSGGNLIYSVLKVRYIFYTDDGSSISAVVIGEGMDSGDKASNKAMSAAYKYACFQIFCIPTEEMKDPDADTPEPSEPLKANHVCCVCGCKVGENLAERSQKLYKGKIYCSVKCRDKDKGHETV